MAVIMQLFGDAFGRPTPGDGQYLKDFDFEAHGGIGEIAMARDKADAKRFADMAEALAFYRTSPECQPTRADGLPNRPLTATNWGFENVE